MMMSPWGWPPNITGELLSALHLALILGWAGLGWAGARLTSDSDPTDFIMEPNYATTAQLPRTLQLHCTVCCSCCSLWSFWSQCSKCSAITWLEIIVFFSILIPHSINTNEKRQSRQPDHRPAPATFHKSSNYTQMTLQKFMTFQTVSRND